MKKKKDQLTKQQMVGMYSSMLKIRIAEERMVEIALQGLIPGWLHPYMGQEAVAVGVVSNLNTEDKVVSTHRGRAHFLAKGMDMKRYMLEILCRKGGICGGKGGEMHMADKEIGVSVSGGIVGGCLSWGLGVAFADQYFGKNNVTVCFFGDGASNQGTFHECVNLAAVWNLPVLFLCENNGWAEFTPREEVMKIETVSLRAAGYGIHGFTVDGDDVVAVYKAAADTIAQIRQGKGPVLMECLTHRWYGQYAGDPQQYRDKDELANVRDFCPIKRFKKSLIDEGILTEKEAEEIKQTLSNEIDEVVEYVKAAPMPDLEELDKYLYA